MKKLFSLTLLILMLTTVGWSAAAAVSMNANHRMQVGEIGDVDTNRGR